MKLYRFAIHAEEDDYLLLQCTNDKKLFTQARSMDDALYMARDLVECWYGTKRMIIEFVIPPRVVTKYERRRAAQAKRRKQATLKRVPGSVKRVA